MSAEQSSTSHRASTPAQEAVPQKSVRDRVRRGRALYRSRGHLIARIAPGVLLVPGCSTPGSFYRVDLLAERCSCADFVGRQRHCKHIFAATLHAARSGARARAATGAGRNRRCAETTDHHPERAPRAA